MPKRMARVKKMTGVKANPPKRGTGIWWILRSSGSSKRFLRKAMSRICGMMIPASNALMINPENMFIVQCCIILVTSY